MSVGYQEDQLEQEREADATQGKWVWQTVKTKGRKSKCHTLLKDQQAWRQVLVMIQQGVFDHVAAQCLGISITTWHRWMVQGSEDEEEGRNTAYREFWHEITMAKARARAFCEMEVRRDDPKHWLSRVAKTRENNPGWTDTVHIGGDPESSPLKLELSGLLVSDDAPPSDLAAVLVMMEELGITMPTQATKHIVSQSQTVEGKVLANTDTNGDEDDADEEDNRIGGSGYRPDKDTAYKDVPKRPDLPPLR